MSGTLGGEWQPASDRANDFGCRPREGRTDPMGHPVALSKAAWRAASRRWMHPIVPRSASGARGGGLQADLDLPVHGAGAAYSCLLTGL